jgi:Uma2 family endonuclease
MGTMQPMSRVAQPSLEPSVHRWTFDQYIQLADSGVFAGQRVELIDAEILDMPAQNDPHAMAVSKLVRELMRIFDENYWVKIQATLRLGDFSGPEPDVAVLSRFPTSASEGEGEGEGDPQPLLIVEVSDTSLAYDRATKGRLYAAHGIAITGC